MTAKPFDPSTFLARYDALDAALVASGFPATSPWWRAQIERFVRSGCRRWVIRAGRRAGKSSTLCRVAVAWSLWGSWSVPPGDTAVIPFVSVDRGEAGARIKTIIAILQALGIRPELRGDEVELTDQRLVFRVVTCSLRGVLGFTSVAIFGDEVAKWESRDTSANPAREVLGSLRPTLATQRHGFEVCSSSPWGEDDYHAELFSDGDTPHQLTSFAETWVGNPTLSMEDTRGLEPHAGTWAREYAGIPGNTVQGDYFGQGIDLSIATEPIPTFPPGQVRYWIACDPAFSESGDRFGYAICSSTVGLWDDTKRERLQPRITRCHAVGSWPVDRSPREMAQRLKDEVCRPFKTYRVLTDQFEGHSFAELASDVGLQIRVVHWRGGEHSDTDEDRPSRSKSDAFSRVRREMLQSQVVIPDDAQFIRELRSVRSTLLPSGTERIDIPRTKTGHGDATSAFILAASMALEKRPELPPQWESVSEKFEREEREFQHEQMMIAFSCGGGGYL